MGKAREAESTPPAEHGYAADRVFASPDKQTLGSRTATTRDWRDGLRQSPHVLRRCVGCGRHTLLDISVPVACDCNLRRVRCRVVSLPARVRYALTKDSTLCVHPTEIFPSDWGLSLSYVGRLSLFKRAANRGSLCKLFSRGSTLV